MIIRAWRIVAGVALWAVGTASGVEAQTERPAAGGEKLQQRPPWTTSQVKGTPEPPLPFITQRAFPLLKFNQCLDLVAAPGSDRLFVVEQTGKIFSFPNRPDVATADLVVDLAKEIPGVQQVYALAFHPDFVRNRYCYVCYILAPDLPEGTHVARFLLRDTDPPTLDVASEQTVITWLSGGHNGCSLKFGPDGFLYISTGDGGPANPPDPLKTGQNVNDLLSSILRMDVDQSESGRNYRIPPDNPFVGEERARGEVWAYGLRNPWRMSFDRMTGDFWVGDVGWELWEMLYRIERGGNYGWGVMEGRQASNPEWPRGPTPMLLPTIDHPHSESSSITDGLTYYGNRLKELHGVHIYSDYDTGKFWGFRYDQGRVVDHRELADTTHRVVGFGEDHQGEFYILDHTAGTLHQLVPNPDRDRQGMFPIRLSQTGLFASVGDQTPAPGVVPYSINAQPWSDHARGERWVAIPESQVIKTDTPQWVFPQDSVLVKTLTIEREVGRPETRRRLETQLLHFDGGEWLPYTYQWNDEQTDAVLVGPAGAERVLEVKDPAAPGGLRRQTWRFPSRAECQRCHNKWSGPPLAFHTPQLNRTDNLHGFRYPQLDALSAMQVLEKNPPGETLPQLADPYDPQADLDGRARGYLQVNCAHCHRMHAGSSVLSKMHYDLPLEKTDMVGVRPTQGTFGMHAPQVIAPGDPYRSVLLYRLAKLGAGRMPHIGSSEVDHEGVALIAQWIGGLPEPKLEETPALETVRRLREHESATLEALRSSLRKSDPQKLVAELLASTSGALRLLLATDQQPLAGEVGALVLAQGARHEDPGIRDLFERFLPVEERVRRLGTAVQPEKILAMSGDPQRGRRVFFETNGVQCKTCHKIGSEGKEVGPDLTTIGKNYTPAELLESLLEPSKRIDPKFVTYLAETVEGRLVTGLLVQKTADEVVLKDAQNNETRIPVRSIEQLVPQRQSLMPDLLLRDMTAQQVADLLAYLKTLK
ncbi:MAG: PQQ-dependent sugar dehydrogenase [Planctomycetales bacterium]